MPQINLRLLKINARNYPWRARDATLKESHEGDVIFVQATTYFVRCKLNIKTMNIRGMQSSHYLIQIVDNVDDYSCVRHPPRHRLSRLERNPMSWVCGSSLRQRRNVVCPCVG
jgi:hypothetical protein